MKHSNEGPHVAPAKDGKDKNESGESRYMKSTIESAFHEGGEWTSAEKLAGRVLQAIRRFGILHSAECHCKADGYTVVLFGTVPSFYDKVMFQTIASKVPDVRRVINELKVVRD